jgi:hypothetical protein
MSIQGPITRARARQLNLEFTMSIQALFCLVLGIDCYLMIMLWLGIKGRTRKYSRKGLEAWWTSKGAQAEVEAQTKSTSGPFRSPGAVCAKTGLTVAYRLGFGHSFYVWKLKKMIVPMALVSGPNSSRVVGNRQRKLTSRIWFGVATPYFGLWALYRVGTH